MESVLTQILHSNLPTADKKKLIDQYRDQRDKEKNKVYEFFREHLKDDKKMMEMARKHYDRYLSNDTDYSCFEDWFNGCVYDMSGKCWKEGVEDWLGQLKYQGEFEQYLESINFQEFLDDMDYKCEVHFGYSDGRCPGSVYSMMVDPTIHIDVELIDWA